MAYPPFVPKSRLWRPSTLFMLGLLMLLGGCATPPGTPSANNRDLEKLDHWSIEGKLGFRSPQKNGSAFLRWQQRGAAYDVHLNGPFGAASTRIQGDPDHAVLSQSGEQDFVAESGEALSERLFGWPFPVTELPYWVKGLAAPGPASERGFDDLGLLTALRQGGWVLEFSDYAQFQDWTLPTRIRGRRGDYGFTLVVKNWRPGPAPRPSSP